MPDLFDDGWLFSKSCVIRMVAPHAFPSVLCDVHPRLTLPFSVGEGNHGFSFALFLFGSPSGIGVLGSSFPGDRG